MSGLQQRATRQPLHKHHGPYPPEQSYYTTVFVPLTHFVILIMIVILIFGVLTAIKITIKIKIKKYSATSKTGVS